MEGPAGQTAPRPGPAPSRPGVLVVGVFDVLRIDVVEAVSRLAHRVGPVSVGVLDDDAVLIERGSWPLADATARAELVAALRGVAEVRLVDLREVESFRSGAAPVILWEVAGGVAADLAPLG